MTILEIVENCYDTSLSWNQANPVCGWRDTPQWFRELYAQITLERIEDDRCKALIGSIEERPFLFMFKSYVFAQSILTKQSEEESIEQFNEEFQTSFDMDDYEK